MPRQSRGREANGHRSEEARGADYIRKVTHPGQRWKAGDHLTHRFNPELGIGRVTAIEGRALVVHFADAGTTLRIAGNSDALDRIEAESAIQRPRLERSRPLVAPVDADILRDIGRVRAA